MPAPRNTSETTQTSGRAHHSSNRELAASRVTASSTYDARLKSACASQAAVRVPVSQLEIPLDTVQAFFEHGKGHGATTLLNPSPAQACPASLLEISDLLVLNETEAALLAGVPGLDADDVHAVQAAARAV